MSTNALTADRQEAIDILRKLCPPGTKVYTVLRHVSKSGMTRDLDCYVMEDGEPRWITGYVCRATGFTRKGDHARVGGCGMDIGFHLVYELSARLYAGGHGCTGEGCTSNDHSNGDRSYVHHGLYNEHGQPEDREPAPGEKADGCVQHWHRDGGYALKQVWL